jgi:hypothetical protein
VVAGQHFGTDDECFKRGAGFDRLEDEAEAIEEVAAGALAFFAALKLTKGDDGGVMDAGNGRRYGGGRR